MRQAAADLPGVAATISGWRAAVTAAGRDLGIAEAPDALRDRVPSEGHRSRIQAAMNRRATLATRRDETAAALDRASRRRDAAATALEALPVPASPVPLRRAIDAVRAEGPLDLELAKAERMLAEASRAAAAAVAALPLWDGDAAALAACPVPLPAATESVAKQLQGTAEAVGEPPADGPAHLAFSGLAARLTAARASHAEAEALTGRIATHEAAAADAGRRQTAAAKELATLQAMAGAADELGLEEAIRRARRRDELAGTVARLEQHVLEQGDGLDETALRTEAAGIDADAAMLRLGEIAEEQSVTNDEATRLGAGRAEVEARLTQMRIGRDAAGHAQDAENALADAREAAARYARVHLARALLRAGVERFRADQQGPLLRAAGEHFALLTSGRYARLGVDEDSGGRAILLAVQEDGIECPIEGLGDVSAQRLRRCHDYELRFHRNGSSSPAGQSATGRSPRPARPAYHSTRW